MERGIVPTSGLYQVAIIVRDLHRTAEHYQELLGIGPWQVVSIDDSMFEESTYRGRPVKHRFDLALAMSGPMQIELIQPIEGETIYADFLREHGEGVHHLGHIRVDDLDEAVRAFEQRGAACIQSGCSQRGGGYAYMDTVGSLGFVTEILKGRDGPPPGYPDSLWTSWQREADRAPATTEPPT
jgi:hypothetical protein